MFLRLQRACGDWPAGSSDSLKSIILARILSFTNFINGQLRFESGKNQATIMPVFSMPKPLSAKCPLMFILLIHLVAAVVHAEKILIVSPDGSGHFKTVQEAIMSVPAGTSTNPVVLRIKPGTYKELVYVQREKRSALSGRRQR